MLLGTGLFIWALATSETEYIRWVQLELLNPLTLLHNAPKLNEPRRCNVSLEHLSIARMGMFVCNILSIVTKYTPRL